MPILDRTGPSGAGPMTGRRAGLCTNGCFSLRAGGRKFRRRHIICLAGLISGLGYLKYMLSRKKN